jgi:mycothiol synthase
MTLSVHKYQSEDDYNRIRAFLHRVFLANDRREFSWQTYRFDYWRWHGVQNLGHGTLETHVFIWEGSDGEIGAVLNGEGPGNAWLQVDPALRTPELEAEMISLAEKHLSSVASDGRHKVRVWAIEDDRLREKILKECGFVRSEAVEYARRRNMEEPVPSIDLAEGYSIRALGGPDEIPARSWLSWRAFHPSAPDSEYQGPEWYCSLQKAPLYRPDLDLVAVAPDGELAAFCTIWFDAVTRTGAFEPVGTSPEHQRRGLASAVMCEGLRRLKQLGATMAYVGSWNVATHKLYGSLAFTDYEINRGWVKETRVGAV